ncbi:Kunitz-type serine protease inhibitor spermatin [Taenia crassiceps]|uniref:Kunitz-type serine protease inhibitor spermatin n=1 Tax=Taenia crassiceps TaxID=6207 RepID=A0ABR4QBP4_9CEST
MNKLILFALVVLCVTCFSQGKVNICTLPMDKGLCKSHIKSYAYNPKKNRCERFFYTGCGGNANRFKHKRDCKRYCIKKK